MGLKYFVFLKIMCSSELLCHIFRCIILMFILFFNERKYSGRDFFKMFYT